MRIITTAIGLLLATSCNPNNHSSHPSADKTDPADSIAAIKTPGGFNRLQTDPGSFTAWLRTIPLKKDNTVYLFNGSRKRNQSAQFAVMDIPVGDRDLQQCADAVMRLRAEYLFSNKRYSEIEFWDNAGKSYKWKGGSDRAAFEQYLITVFGWCGSASLEKQLKQVVKLEQIQPGDVFIKGGFPGHAMLVVDVAVNDKGKKIFMLAQSYMPAQNIHVVKNPGDEKQGPWYEVTDEEKINTPEWTFTREQLRRW
jgi:hypothetical protein